MGLPAGSTPLDPPDRRRHGRPGGGRAELRRDHLLQGRLGAGPAGGLRRAGGVPGRAAGSTSSGTRTATPHSPTCWPPCTPPPGRDLSDWSAQWLETAGVNTLQPEIERRRRRTITLVRGPCRVPPPDHADAAPAPDRHRPLRRERRRQARPDPAGSRPTSTVRGPEIA